MMNPTVAHMPTESSIDHNGKLLSFCEEIGALLQRYGDPSHRVELALSLVAQRFGYTGQFFATNTALIGSISNGNGTPQVFLRRSEPGDIDLGKLAELEHIVDELVAGNTTLSEAHAQIIAINHNKRRYTRTVEAAAYLVASAGTTCFFGGGKNEVLVAAVIGLITGLLSMLNRLRAARLLEIVSAFAAVIVANLFALVMSPLSISTTILGGLIVLFPGLTLTTAIVELANRHLVSGSARLTGALITFLCMALGVVFGTQTINSLIGTPTVVDPVPLGVIAEVVALLVTPVALMVLFRGEWRDLLWMTVSAFVAYSLVRLGVRTVDPAIAAFLGAAATGLYGNAFAFFTRRPSSITTVPSLMILVPGSLGFRSVTQLLSDDIVTGVESAFNVGIIATAIVAGLLVANALFAPHRR